MKTKRNVAPRPMTAQVISMEAYRRARGVPAPERLDHDSLMAAYCRWLALVGALWALWW